MKKYFYILIIILLFSCSNKKEFVTIELNSKEYKFEIANTIKQREKGLMFRKKLAKNSGMLFVYPQERILYYYMKNTLIPLDIAFIDRNYNIINIEKMEPLDETTVRSKKKALFALEVNRGFFTRIGVKVGDKIESKTPIRFVVE